MRELRVAMLALIAGIMFGTGVRAIAWAVPVPPTKAIICYAADVGKVEGCKPISDIVKAETPKPEKPKATK